MAPELNVTICFPRSIFIRFVVLCTFVDSLPAFPSLSLLEAANQHIWSVLDLSRIGLGS